MPTWPTGLAATTIAAMRRTGWISAAVVASRCSIRAVPGATSAIADRAMPAAPEQTGRAAARIAPAAGPATARTQAAAPTVRARAAEQTGQAPGIGPRAAAQSA